ncbi:organic cation transporter protein-like isoform X1 [Mizuhopecten yessoensis]|uniref:Solute carrier family 22 member 6-A n=1 Tax=Mizuhopecten yessoensis TaxID=6573 RepID=A0A210QFL0_MIZYE|nr:organic cation transporter protein-like isoform X1 [Mizuhopecten yessoensis]OWF47532.1 Solute carrier family 22 member 6-A [Mizuhopecten yessoensis]
MAKLNYLDDAWRTLGVWGRYQCIQIFLQLTSVFSESVHLMVIVFIGYRPSYQCADLGNTTSMYDTLSNASLTPLYQACHVDILINGTNTTLMKLSPCPAGYTYDLEKDRTFVTEWDLVCEGAERAEVSQMLLMIGQMVGAAFLPQLSDKFGRKVVLVTSQIALFASGVGASLLPTFTCYAIMRFICGFSHQGMAMARAVMTVEILPEESRFMAEVLGCTVWTIGLCVIAPLAYIMRDLSWRYLYLVLSLTSVHCLLGFWTFDESILWLLANGKIDKAKTLLRKAAKMNKVNEKEVLQIVDNATCTSTVLQEKLIKKPNQNQNVDGKQKERKEVILEQSPAMLPKYTVLTLFTRRRIAMITLIMTYTWLVNSLTYYGLSLSSASLPLDRYLSFFLLSLAELPVAVIEYYTFNRLGRKKLCIIFHAVAAVSLIAGTVANYLSDRAGANVALMIFYFLGKMAIAGSFSTIFLFTPELYPTNLRNVGIGFSSAAGRIGGMLAPFAGPLAERISWAPGAIFGIMCLTVAMLLPLLPEPTGHELPTTVEELERWYKQHSGMQRKKTVDTSL